MRNLLIGARSGEDRAAYPSAEARAAGIEESAALPVKDLMADLAGSAMAFRAIARQLTGENWRYPVRILDSGPIPAAQLLTRRLVEVELHHCDLGAGYSPADWPAAFAAMDLAEPMRSQRQDRIDRPRPELAAPWPRTYRRPGGPAGARSCKTEDPVRSRVGLAAEALTQNFAE